MALKPIPRLILIVGVLVGIGYGAVKMGLLAPKTPTEQTQAVTAAVQKSAQADTPVTGDLLRNITAQGQIKVGVQSPSRPFFSNPERPTGFNVDFLKLMLANDPFSGVTTAYQTVDTYEAVPETVSKGGADIAIDGLTFTEADTPGVVYSIPYVEDFGYALITPPNGMLRPDLNGAVIGILKGDPDVKSYATAQFPKATLVELSDEAVNGKRDWIDSSIKNGKVDAVIYDYPFAVAEIEGTNLKFAVSKLPGSDIKYKIAVRTGERDLLNAVNLSIRKAKMLPEYADLIRKYFASSSVTAKAASSSERSYTVKKGDTLSIIAEATLGNAMRYPEIETRNNLPNPNLISVGQKLVIPK